MYTTDNEQKNRGCCAEGHRCAIKNSLLPICVSQIICYNFFLSAFEVCLAYGIRRMLWSFVRFIPKSK